MSLPDAQHHRRNSSLERRDPFSSPSVYYDEDAVRRQLLGARNRTVSSVCFNFLRNNFARRCLPLTRPNSTLSLPERLFLKPLMVLIQVAGPATVCSLPP